MEEFLIKTHIYNDEEDGGVEINISSEFCFELITISLVYNDKIIFEPPDKNLAIISISYNDFEEI